MKKFISVFLLIFIFFGYNPFGTLQIVHGQTKDKIKKTIRGEFQLPRATSNKAFMKNFSGVFNTGVSMNFGRKHFTAGGFYSLTQFQVFPGFQQSVDNPHTILTIHTAGIKFSYDMLTSTGNGMFSPFISPGYSWLKYTRIKSKNHPPGTTHLATPGVSFGAAYNIMMDEWTGAGFIIGYNMINHVYRPENVCLDEWYSYSEDEKRGVFQNLFFGFSVYFDLAKKPDTAE